MITTLSPQLDCKLLESKVCVYSSLFTSVALTLGTKMMLNLVSEGMFFFIPQTVIDYIICFSEYFKLPVIDKEVTKGQ